MTELPAGLPPPYLVLLIGAAVTYVWRALGVALAGRVKADSAALEWIGCVAYALLAGLIARMIVLPIGPLADTALAARLAAAIMALAIFFLLRRSVMLGVAAGAGALVLLSWVECGSRHVMVAGTASAVWSVIPAKAGISTRIAH